jgi:hypothetical protein
VVGAVQAIVAHPTNARIVWIGTTNGGLWRSESLIYRSDGIDNDRLNLIDDARQKVKTVYDLSQATA